MAQQQQQSHAGGAAPAGAGSGPGGQLNLEALRNNPQIQQLREQMAQNPQLIGPLIQQLATQNPTIAQIIAQNPEALLQLLGIELGGAEGEEDGLPPGAHVVSVTEEERAAIQRVSHRHSLTLTINSSPFSWKLWDFHDRLSLRPILPVIRMKSSLPITYSKVDLMISYRFRCYEQSFLYFTQTYHSRY